MNKQPTQKFKDFTKTYFSGPEQMDLEKRNGLILSSTPLIRYIASRLAPRLPPHVSTEDLISCGIIGLIDAIEKFDLSKNVQFKTYAEFRIKGAMLDELRSLDWVPRSVRRKVAELENAYANLEKKLGRPANDEEVAAAMRLDIDDFFKLLDDTKAVTFLDVDMLRKNFPEVIDNSFQGSLSISGEDPYAAVSLGQIKELVAQAISQLPEKEKLAVALYYFEELTMKEIGEVLGYTVSRISQMHSKAMLRLRAKMKKALGG
jgi:RNA polymerase sigma factor for flagellar operon FliA